MGRHRLQGEGPCGPAPHLLPPPGRPVLRIRGFTSATGADGGPPEQELKDALAERGLDTTGLKAVLVERLSAALAGGEDEPAAAAAAPAAAEEEPAEEPAAAPAEAAAEAPKAAEEEAGAEAPAAAEEPAAPAPAEEAPKEEGELEVQNGAIGDANIGGLGLNKSLKAMTEAEKMARRAARFGIIPKAAPKKKPPPSAEKKPKKKKGGVDPELQKKLDARAARFGTGKKQGGPSKEEVEKLEARKARFEAPPLSDEMKAKMEARAAKFGGHTEQAMKRMGLPLGGEAKKQKA